RRADVPVGELAVLARDERIELHRTDQRIDTSRARRILIEPVFEHPLVGVAIRPDLETFRALPVERFVIGREDGGRSGNRTCEVVHERGFGHDLWRVAGWGRSRPELAWRTHQQRLEVRPSDIAWIGPDPFARRGRDRAGPNGVRAVGFRFRDNALGDLASELESGVVV